MEMVLPPETILSFDIFCQAARSKEIGLIPI